MTATLHELLLAPETQPKVVADCCTLIEREVSDMSGISGAAIKLAHKAVITFAPGHVRHMVKVMLPDMVDALQPFWADFAASGGSGFGDYLAKRGDEVAEALLAVTDARSKASDRPVIIKAYNSVRGNAGTHIKAALPRLGELVHQYAA